MEKINKHAVGRHSSEGEERGRLKKKLKKLTKLFS
jgi:hypothetical protein